jgi:hypothetical protein
MEFISERVSIDRTEGRFSVVISPRLSPLKRNLLVLWLLLWTLCGAYIFYARTEMPEGSAQRQYFLAFLAFWAYFELRMLRVVLWRLKGFELWRVKDGRLTVKDSILGLGSANHYFIENIKQLGFLQIDLSSFKWQLNESPWVIGGERIGFEHLGKKVVIGKGLHNEEAKQLVLELKRAMKAR